MKVCFVETANATPHLETSLELAKKHLLAGDVVDYYFLGNAVSYSDCIVYSRLKQIFRVFPEVRGAAMLTCSNFYFHKPRDRSLMKSINIPEFLDLNDLLEYNYDKYRAGLSAFSSLVSATGEPRPSLVENRQLLKQILTSGISIYDFCIEMFQEQNPDQVYLFNGRFSNNRAVLDAANSCDIRYRVHERGANKDKYYVKPFTPHNIREIQLDMIQEWDQRPINASNIASEYFMQRRNGIPIEWPSFIEQQCNDHLSVDLTDANKVVSCFSSSDDEFVAVGDFYKWDRWPDQISAVCSLMEIVSRHKNYKLIIRLHPRLAQKNPAELKNWLSLPLPCNCFMILPDDPTDSYALIERSCVTVTAGSTVGIESVFWKTPSICLGPSLYSHLNAVYLPADNHELESLILSESLVANPESSLPYGFYMATHGVDFEYYKAESLFEGKFMGLNLHSYGVYGFLRKLKAKVFRRSLS
jgi:hypothetical protein